VKLRIFAGGAPIIHKGNAAFGSDMSRQLSNCWVELVPPVHYEHYMSLMEEGDFAIDVFPFAGSNTVSDNLYLRKPTLVREGYRWFNRIGPAMLRSAGLLELIATTDDEYGRKLIRLVDDVDYRAEQAQQLAEVDLTNTVYAAKGAKQFAQFVRNVVSDKSYYKGTEPIVMSETN
jgi:predicted O-linked N-acetylglucosamine transferase (SPINDLY family)